MTWAPVGGRPAPPDLQVTEDPLIRPRPASAEEPRGLQLDTLFVAFSIRASKDEPVAQQDVRPVEDGPDGVGEGA